MVLFRSFLFLQNKKLKGNLQLLLPFESVSIWHSRLIHNFGSGSFAWSYLNHSSSSPVKPDRHHNGPRIEEGDGTTHAAAHAAAHDASHAFRHAADDGDATRDAAHAFRHAADDGHATHDATHDAAASLQGPGSRSR